MKARRQHSHRPSRETRASVAIKSRERVYSLWRRRRPFPARVPRCPFLSLDLSRALFLLLSPWRFCFLAFHRFSLGFARTSLLFKQVPCMLLRSFLPFFSPPRRYKFRMYSRRSVYFWSLSCCHFTLLSLSLSRTSSPIIQMEEGGRREERDTKIFEKRCRRVLYGV